MTWRYAPSRSDVCAHIEAPTRAHTITVCQFFPILKTNCTWGNAILYNSFMRTWIKHFFRLKSRCRTHARTIHHSIFSLNHIFDIIIIKQRKYHRMWAIKRRGGWLKWRINEVTITTSVQCSRACTYWSTDELPPPLHPLCMKGRKRRRSSCHRRQMPTSSRRHLALLLGRVSKLKALLE